MRPRFEVVVMCRHCHQPRPFAGALICWKCQVAMAADWPEEPTAAPAQEGR